MAEVLPGFADVEYPDWQSILSRLARDAIGTRWSGPLVFDEFPYLVSVAADLPSLLQRWLDHDARKARLSIVLAGSSQRMMQGLVLAANAPLYGRAAEVLQIEPLGPIHLRDALREGTIRGTLESYAAWGGVPRYWELAAEAPGTTADRLDRLVLDPLGPLHTEPDHLLLEELPPAVELRPILDAIGSGAHRVSEIAGRIGYRATSLARPLKRLVDMQLVRREVPFAESERESRRGVYGIADPFLRLWFRVVAPHRAFLAVAPRAARKAHLRRAWAEHAGAVWEDLCRRQVPRLSDRTTLGALGPWNPPRRWWAPGGPEWDVVAESVDGRRLLVGEARWAGRGVTSSRLLRLARSVARKPLPQLPPRFADFRDVPLPAACLCGRAAPARRQAAAPA